jgi:hypothetical protein
VKEVQNIFYFPLHIYYQNTTIVIETCLNIEEVGESYLNCLFLSLIGLNIVLPLVDRAFFIHNSEVFR